MLIEELPKPAKPQHYFCNKCGAFGEGSGDIHNRPNGNGQCGYSAANEGPYYTADQLREVIAAARAEQRDDRMLIATADVFADYMRDAKRLHEACRRLVRWRLCMSHNDSYFGESAGELKRMVHEIERLLPAPDAIRAGGE